MISPRQSSVRRIAPELIALGLLVPLVLIVGTYVWRTSHDVATASPTPTLLVETLTPSASPTVTSNTPTTLLVSPLVSPSTTTVGLTIKGTNTTNYAVPVTGETTVADILQLAQQQGLHMTTKDYGGSLGLYVSEINGTTENTAEQIYWHLYINGQRSPLGASSARVSPGETIMWSYEKAHAE